MSRCRRARPFLMTLALLGSTSVAARAADEVSLKGGAFDQLTTVELTGTPGRKYLVLISVFNTPGMSYIPDVTYDIGSEFLNVSLAVPGFIGAFNAEGKASFPLIVPHFPILETMPLYVQMLTTGEFGNKLVSKSPVQTWTLQHVDSWENPLLSLTMPDTDRSQHTMTLLPGGKEILIAGGGPSGIATAFCTDLAAIYDISTEEVIPLANKLISCRTAHTATLLQDGRVLIAGGASSGGSVGALTTSTEFYDPQTQTFSPGPDMTGLPRALHRASLLQDGRVLISGGTSGWDTPNGIITGTLDSTTIFDPSMNAFIPGPTMIEQRLGHTSTAMPDGRVLLAGGYTLLFGVLPVITDQAETYIPSPGLPGTVAGPFFMFSSRFGHEATLLQTGKVFLAAGANGSDPFAPTEEKSWEIFDPVFGFSTAGPILHGRMRPSLDLLPDGRALLAGGAQGDFTAPISIDECEIWDPVTQTMSLSAPLIDHRGSHQSLVLPDGTVLISGGGQGWPGAIQASLGSLEIYQP